MKTKYTNIYMPKTKVIDREKTHTERAHAKEGRAIDPVK